MLDLTVIYFFSVFIFFVYLVIKNISHKENNYQQHFYNMFVLLVLYFFIFVISISFISKKLLFPSGVLFLLAPPIFFILFKLSLKSNKNLGFHYPDVLTIFIANLLLLLGYYTKMKKNHNEIQTYNEQIKVITDTIHNLDNYYLDIQKDSKLTKKQKYRIFKQVRNDLFINQLEIKKNIDELIKKYAPLLPFYSFIQYTHFDPDSIKYMLL